MTGIARVLKKLPLATEGTPELVTILKESPGSGNRKARISGLLSQFR
jgi:hypothetical protein